MKINYFKIFFIVTFFALNYNFAFSSGADLILKSPEGEVKTNSPFSVSVLLDTSGDDTNAVEGALSFNEDFFEFVSIVDGNSVVTSWVQKPEYENGKIVFSGIMAGGYLGTIDPLTNAIGPGILFEIILIPKTEGIGSVTLSDAKIYKNDGLGTSKSVATKDLKISSDVNGVSNYLDKIDDVRPLVFSPIISKNNEMFEGRYFLVFDTKDKESGIDYFEVKEGRKDWVRAESPYVLTDQTLTSRIRVKAVDNAGNERIVTYGEKTNFPISILSIPIVLLLGIIVFIYFWYTRKIRVLSVK